MGGGGDGDGVKEGRGEGEGDGTEEEGVVLGFMAVSGVCVYVCGWVNDGECEVCSCSPMKKDTTMV